MVLRKRESRSSPPSRSRVERPGSFFFVRRDEWRNGGEAHRHLRTPHPLAGRAGAADDIIFIGAGFIGAGEIFALLAAKDYRRYSPDSNLR